MANKDIEIACPKCNWQPDGGEYWECNCGHNWDTFKTAARCPKCGMQHKMTACMPSFMGGCSKMSPHIDWYRNLDELLEEELEAINEEELVNHVSNAR